MEVCNSFLDLQIFSKVVTHNIFVDVFGWAYTNVQCISYVFRTSGSSGLEWSREDDHGMINAPKHRLMNFWTWHMCLDDAGFWNFDDKNIDK